MAVAGLSLSLAAACPVKPGFIAAGLMKTPQGVHARCELLKVLKRPELQWVEVYSLDPARADGIMRQLLATLSQKGYRVVTDDRQPSVITLGLEGPSGSLVVQRSQTNGTHLLVLARPRQ